MSLKSKSKTKSKPLDAFTDFGSLVDGRLNLKGSSKNLQDVPIESFLSLIQGEGNLLDRFKDNQTGFIASQINPFRDNLKKRLADTRTSLTRRNVAGSTFGEGFLTQQNNIANRKLQDATARANLQAIGGEQNIIQGAASGISQELQQRIANLLGIASQGGTNTTRSSSFDPFKVADSVGRGIAGFGA